MEPAAQPRRGDREPPEGREDASRQGVMALPPPARIAVAIALGAVGVFVAVHLVMVFLHVAPSNTLSRQHGEVVEEYVYPEFEQNWKLFAPNPLQQNVAVHARAEVRKPDGATETTGWVDLTAMDVEEIRGNPVPSHTAQNELRRAWDFFTGSHDDQHQPNGVRGELSEEYLKRIVMLRFGPELNGGEVTRVQVRSATTPVAPPPWSDENTSTETTYRELPWWPVDRTDVPGGE
ncbi:DUF5819 family protein [Streptomyces sp. TRM 70361]|uniref:DUF5819 family protein n=1 Tax=Streptomyces sp. TRM 70361 TaxID=3116553 RepID=UPI002E7BCCA1|nr:DUF5819 family protein [Streptomyces sp. TRM 70361]MEE1939481.1 DUF5819 family protein [Streptomyces sp. TRM 70361]